jgi:hypothetical protein
MSKRIEGIGKTLIPVLVGALVSGLSSWGAGAFISSNQYKRDMLDKKFEFNRNLSKDLGTQLSPAFEFLIAVINHDGDTLLVREKLFNSRNEWNSNIFSNRPLIKYYYGQKALDSFKNTVLDSMYNVTGEILAKSEQYPIKLDDEKLSARLTSVKLQFEKFIENLYALAENGKKWE